MGAEAPFAHWRVLELCNGLAAAYCGKMFTDAGADVVKIESTRGDALRGWSAGGPPGALFGYLAAGKKADASERDVPRSSGQELARPAVLPRRGN